VLRPIGFGVAVLAFALRAGTAAAGDLSALERGIAADPENLRLAADYRQLAIADKDFDRPIRFLEKLAKRPEAGPNVQISLALAYVDKVPTSGDIRRLYLGRDALNALTKSIEQRPSAMAYYIRGQINLYYNNFVFKRIPRGLDDLRKSLTLLTANMTCGSFARVFVAIGDGEWRLGNAAKAKAAWTGGLERCPEDVALKRRLVADAGEVEHAVAVALDPATRVDTSLRGVVVP
jgi:hypothetical protein